MAVPEGKRQFSITVDDELLAELDRLSAEQRRSRSNMVEWLLARSIEFGKAVSGS